MTTPPVVKLTPLRVYFLRHGKVQGVRRTVPATATLTDAALAALTKGPSAPETELGLSRTSRPPPSGRLGERATACSASISALERAALAQVVYTLTQFPTVKAVEIDGKRYTRADFEDETPTILVESPLPFQTVKSPLRATGTANTFEATFQYDLVDSERKLVKTHFVTATSGTGTRGTFDFTVPFPVSRAGPASWSSTSSRPRTGRGSTSVEIPLRLAG